MTQQDTDQDLWYDFQTLAVEAVRRGHDPDWDRSCRYHRFLQVIEIPSFDTVVGWQLFGKWTETSEGMPDEFIATRTAWLQERDMEAFRTPIDRLRVLRLKHLHRLAPALEFATVKADRDIVGGLISRLGEARMPNMITRTGVGLDGTTYEVVLGDYMAGVTFHWWEHPPEAWRELGETAMELLAHLADVHAEGTNGER
jgi:hypothetical protein